MAAVSNQRPAKLTRNYKEVFSVTLNFKKQLLNFIIGTFALLFFMNRFNYKKIQKKIKLISKEETDTVLSNLKDEGLTVTEIKEQERRRRAPAPYITSKLQQDAANRLGFTTKKTMIVDTDKTNMLHIHYRS